MNITTSLCVFMSNVRISFFPIASIANLLVHSFNHFIIAAFWKALLLSDDSSNSSVRFSRCPLFNLSILPRDLFNSFYLSYTFHYTFISV